MQTAHAVQEQRQRHLADVCDELGLRKPRDKQDRMSEEIFFSRTIANTFTASSERLQVAPGTGRLLP